MAKAFSLASWNVEHFQNASSRVDRVVSFLTNLPSLDVFSLYEVEGAEVFGELVSRMPGYTFHITEGPQAQEILVGVKPELTAFFTQKLEFKAGLQFLRPGALLTVTIDSKHYPILSCTLRAARSPSASAFETTCSGARSSSSRCSTKPLAGPPTTCSWAT